MVRMLTFSRLLILIVIAALVRLPAVAAPAVAPAAAGAAISPDLGRAASFSVLAGDTAANTGTTSMPGNMGVASNNAPTGFVQDVNVGPPGTIEANTPSAYDAKIDADLAFTALGAETDPDCDTTAVAIDLIGLTFLPGVHCFTGAVTASGLFTLDGGGDPAAVWIFRMNSTLAVAAGGSVNIINGGCADNVWWKAGSTVTLGAGGNLKGNILAGTTFTMGDGASLEGRALAKTTVMFTNNPITAPFCALAVDGTVYIDLNNDGLYTSSAIDYPLANVSVAITDSLGAPYTVLTDASGYFTQTVAAGSTVVDVDNASLPPDVTLTTNVNNEGSDPTTVVVPVGGLITDNTGYVNPPAGKSSIGDCVWNDANVDGFQTTGEVGINGVTVWLYKDGANGNLKDDILQAGERISDTVTAAGDSKATGTVCETAGYYDFRVVGDETYWTEVIPSNFNTGGPLDDYLFTSENTVGSNPYKKFSNRSLPP